MKKNECVVCGKTLPWQDFAYNQDTCWECFREQFLIILEKHSDKERELLNWMMAIVADKYGYEW